MDRDSKSKSTVEREVKITPAREISKDRREPTPREKSVKEEKRDRETKEREDSEHNRKREKEKDKRREKRPSSPVEFEGDLSSVSNSSNGSIQPNSDVVIVDEPKGNNYLIN